MLKCNTGGATGEEKAQQMGEETTAGFASGILDGALLASFQDRPRLPRFDAENEDFITVVADLQPLPFPACHRPSKTEALARRPGCAGNVPISVWVLSHRTPHSRFSTTTCGKACRDLYSQSSQYDLIAS